MFFFQHVRCFCFTSREMNEGKEQFESNPSYYIKPSVFSLNWLFFPFRFTADRDTAFETVLPGPGSSAEHSF